MACGTKRMGSTTTSCASRMEPPLGSRSAPWWACCPFVQRPWSSPGSGNGCLTFWSSSRSVCGECHGSFRASTRLDQAILAWRGIAALVGPDRLRRILSRMLDENEFLSPYGLRAVSRYHAEHPYVFRVQGEEYRVDYLPAESNTGMFGGNSNWRGPIWMPVNVMLIRALLQFYLYYGDNFKVECPTGSGNLMNLFEVSREI